MINSLELDKPKTGGFGSTIDSNSVREAFNAPTIFAEVTGIDLTLIKNLRIIYICISCLFPINVMKFQSFCYNTGEVIIDNQIGFGI